MNDKKNYLLSNYSGPSYEGLPMEIIWSIMEYLHPKDVMEAGLTCRRWLEASLHHKFTSKIVLNFSRTHLGEGLDGPSAVEDFEDSIRNYSKIVLNHVDVAYAHNFWQRFGQHITEITFNSCDLREKVFSAILKQLTNLRALQIDNCRELFMSGRLFNNAAEAEAVSAACANVTSISLSNNRYLSDALFNRMVGTMPNVESLDLSGCQISFHNGLYRKFYPPRCQQEPSESVLTFYYISRFIEAQARKLIALNFSGTLIDGAALVKLTEIPNLHIKEFRVRSCDQLTGHGICAFVSNQHWLTELDLSLTIRLTDPSLIEICKHLNELKILKLRRCRAITDSSLKEIARLKQLRILDISECGEITSDGLFDGILKQENKVLVELYVSALNICELAIIRIAECMPNLRVLDLSYCKNGVTDLGIQLIFKHLIKLRELNLEFCDKISDAGLSGMGMEDKWLNYNQTKCALEKKDPARRSSEAELLNVAQASVDQNDHPIEELRRALEVSDNSDRNPYHISLRSRAEEDIVNDAKRKKIMLEMCEQNAIQENQNSTQYSITRLRGLRVLNLSTCNRISDVSLIYNFDFPELKTLNLACCQQISSKGIESFLPRCTSIESINLSECHNISDQAIGTITMSLQRLTHLYLERCIHLTDYSLDYIAVNCKRLRHLDVRGCRSMCSEPYLRVEHIRSLKYVASSKPGPYVGTGAAIKVRRPMPPPFPPVF